MYKSRNVHVQYEQRYVRTVCAFYITYRHIYGTMSAVQRPSASSSLAYF